MAQDFYNDPYGLYPQEPPPTLSADEIARARQSTASPDTPPGFNDILQTPFSYQEIGQFFQSLLGRWPTDDEYNEFRTMPRAQAGAAIKSKLSPAEQQFGTWGQDAQPDVPAPATDTTSRVSTPTPQPVTNGSLGDFLRPFTERMPTVGQYALSPSPQFQAPQRRQIPLLQAPDPFRATTEADVRADPSYDFTKGEGERSIINNQAARGARRTGNSLMDLVRYNQDYANTRYGDIDTRRRADYNTGVSNTFHTWEDNLGAMFGQDDRAFQDAMAEFQPKVNEWQVNQSAGQRANELDWSHAFDTWNQDFNIFKRNQEWPYTVLSDQQRLGLQAATA